MILGLAVLVELPSCDRQDKWTHDDSIYRAIITLCCKNAFACTLLLLLIINSVNYVCVVKESTNIY